MIPHRLYSIRMRAASGTIHLSGAERLVPAGLISSIVQELTSRALSRPELPDQIVVTVDSLGDIPIREVRSLDLVSTAARDVAECRRAASATLREAGVSDSAISFAYRHLDSGASPSDGSMRGAMVMDADTGERLEADRSRGVRASRFDWSDEASGRVQAELARIGLTHFRTKEALALATKVAHAPGMVAELCWSDDPDYTAGYAASLATGYVRFPFMKKQGSGRGGRAFFVRRAGLDLPALLHYLQNEAVLITGVGTCSRAG